MRQWPAPHRTGPGRRADTWRWPAAQQTPPHPTGQPMPDAVCRDMSARFGVDFSAVRVHADAGAAASARAHGAAAYAVGREVVFGAGRYAPESAAGQRLLAHELAHVVQQSRGGSSAGAEARADVAAAQATGPGRVALPALGGAPVGVQAQPDPTLAGDMLEDASPLSSSTTTLAGFALNRADLTAAHQQQIETLAWSIKMNLAIRVGGLAAIYVTGHADRSGGEALNLSLGQKRADAVQAALKAALAKEGVSEAQITALDATSQGEDQPAVKTADGVQNATNRRVEIQLDLGQARPDPGPASAPTKPDLRLPGIDTLAPPRRRPGPYRDPAETELLGPMNETQRKIDQTAHLVPKPRSPMEALTDAVLTSVEPLIKLLPDAVQGPLRSGLRAGIEKGSEAACDGAIDASGATGELAEGMKTACKAGLKQKAGGGKAP